MKLRKPRRKRLPWALLLVPAAALAVIAMLSREEPETPDVTQTGVAYLEALEQKDPEGVMQVLRERRRAELEAQRAELLRQLRAGECSPFNMFQDGVIMGDSRAEGYWFYGYVDQTHTLTGPGDTILELYNQLDILEAQNPQYIYLLYGLNDVKIGYWGSMERFVEKYMEYIGQLRQRLPDSVVVVSSILPYREKEADKGSSTEPTEAPDPEVERMKQIPRWNEALEQACQENNVIFVDNAAICEEYADMWEPDGIHVRQTFYQYWAKNLVIAALEEGGTQFEENRI